MKDPIHSLAGWDLSVHDHEVYWRGWRRAALVWLPLGFALGALVA
jgi:hypothetical protein